MSHRSPKYKRGDILEYHAFTKLSGVRISYHVIKGVFYVGRPCLANRHYSLLLVSKDGTIEHGELERVVNHPMLVARFPWSNKALWRKVG